MKKVLLQLDTDEHPSAFDAIVAHDAGVDVLLSYGGVKPEDARELAQDAFFTRGVDDLKTMAVWVGGTRVSAGEEVFAEVQKAFFGPFQVSVMLDSNGCNTTAATTIARIAKAREPRGRAARSCSASAPSACGRRCCCATRAARSRVVALPPDLFDDDRPYRKPSGLGAAQELGLDVREPADRGELEAVLDGRADRRCAAGPAGVQVLRRDFWSQHPTLELLADYNAAEPLGLEGTKATDDLKSYDGKLVLGALAIGGPKMKVHKACVRRLFEANDQVLDTDAVYAVAQGARLSPRVAGIDPGTVSFDVCALDGGEVVLERSFRTADVGADPAPLVEALVRARPVRARARPGRLRAAARSRRAGRRARARADAAAARGRAARSRRRRRDALDRARPDRGRAAARVRPRRDPSADDPGVPQVEPHRPGDGGQGGERRAVHRRPVAPARRRVRRDLVRDARARRGVQRRARRRRRAHRRRARRLGRADRGAGVRRAGRGGGVPARRRAVEADRVQRRRARPAGGSRSLRGWRRCAATRATRGMARLGGGRGQGRARADGQRAGAARDPRRGAPALRACSKRSARGSPTSAPVRLAAGSKAAAHGAAVLADGLAGGRYAALVERLGVRDASGSALDHLRVHGADRIRLR